MKYKMLQLVLATFLLWLIPSWIVKASILWLFMMHLASKV